MEDTHGGSYRDKVWSWDRRKDHPETAPPGDPSHIQLPNTHTITYARTILPTVHDIAISCEAMPVPGNTEVDAHSHLLDRTQGP